MDILASKEHSSESTMRSSATAGGHSDNGHPAGSKIYLEKSFEQYVKVRQYSLMFGSVKNNKKKTT